MNWKDTRTRRKAIAFAAASAVVAGGVGVAQWASATGALTLTTGNAFTALNIGGQQTSSVQTVTATTAFTSNATFTLTYGGVATSSLAYNSTSTQVATALNAVSTIAAAGGVTVTGASDFNTNNNAMAITFKVPGVRTAITTSVTVGGGAGVFGAVAQTTTGGALAQNLANATFGTKVTTTLVGNLTLSLDSYTAPSGVTVTGVPGLLYAQQASNVATGPASAWKSLQNAGATGSVSGSLNGAQDVFLATNQPGTYTFHFVDDAGTVGTGDDIASPTMTATILDVSGATSGTADDWTPAITASASAADIGAPLTATAPFTPLTLVDTRSSNSGVGVLGSKVAALVGLKFTSSGSLSTDLSGGSTNYTTPAAVTATATGGTRLLPVAVSAHAGTVTSTATFDLNGDGTLTDQVQGTTATTVVASNSVSALSLVPTTGSSVAGATVTSIGTTNANANAATSTLGFAGNVGSSSTNSHRIKISKTGETTEYAVVSSGGGSNSLTLVSPLVYAHTSGSTVEDASGVVVKTGTAAVTYTATVTDSDTDKSGNVVYFTLGGTDVASLTTTGTTVDSTSHVFSAVTDANGVASITVTDGASTRVAYTVAASSNGISGGTLTSTYADPAATTLTITSGTAALSPVAGTATVPISGKLTDQFGATFQPPPAASQQVTVSSAVSGYTTLSAGMFTYTYTPSSAPAAGTSQTITFTYAVGTNPTANAVVNWASSVAPAAVTISTPLGSATPAVATYSAIPTGTAVTGSVTDGTNGLAYKTVTLTGDDGIYFSTTSTGSTLVKSLDVASNASGVFTAYAFFTHTGAAKITATSGGKTAMVSPTVAAAANTEGYKVIAIDAAGATGTTLVVAGKVQDVFGNAVSGATVALTTSSSTLGVLGGNSLTTGSNGDFSTSFIAGSNAGVVTVTAKINGGTDRTAGATWSATGGLTLAGGSSTDQSTLTIGSGAPTIEGPAMHAAGSVTISGTAPANASVDIYAKKAGSSDAFGWIGTVKADGTTGDWSKSVTITSSMTFVAKVGANSSDELTVKVGGKATVVASAKAMGKGLVKISVKGSPATTGTITLYVKSGSKWVKVRMWTSTSTGAGSVNVKTGKGAKMFEVVFAPAGSTAGVTTVKVTVK